MKSGPFQDEPARCPRLNIACDHLTAKIKFALLVLVLGMKVRRVMLAVEHPDHDSKEKGDYRQTFSLPLPTLTYSNVSIK